MNDKKKVAFHSLGCKVNSYETDAMQQLLVNSGYEIVPFEPGADVYIINTCTVTNIADRKSRQMLHKAKKMNPDAIVVAAGCYAQVSAEEAMKDAGVDIVVGNNKKHEIVEILAEYTGQDKIAAYSDINKPHTEYETLNITQTAEHTRAYIKIQDGCNQFCSYCLIPYARGRVRSRKMQDIIDEVKTLVKNGYKEIVLTGIHISSYGTDLAKENQAEVNSYEDGYNVNNSMLLELLNGLNNVEGLKRIRLGSLEPRIMTKEFVQEISEMEKICPHFHLSLQSGCEATLKRMNRHYSPQEYRQSCDYIKQYFEHPALTTDVIAGFPGETAQEFLECLEFVDSISFYETHIFKYSKRKGTKAAIMPDQVDEKIKAERSNELIALNKKHKTDFMKYYIGRNTEILVEEKCEINGEEYQTGYTKEYVKVAVKSDKDLSNTIIEGKIEKFLTDDIMLLSVEE